MASNIRLHISISLLLKCTTSSLRLISKVCSSLFTVLWVTNSSSVVRELNASSWCLSETRKYRCCRFLQNKIMFFIVLFASWHSNEWTLVPILRHNGTVSLHTDTPSKDRFKRLKLQFLRPRRISIIFSSWHLLLINIFSFWQLSYHFLHTSLAFFRSRDGRNLKMWPRIWKEFIVSGIFNKMTQFYGESDM